MAQKTPQDIPGEYTEWALEYPARPCFRRWHRNMPWAAVLTGCWPSWHFLDALPLSLFTPLTSSCLN